MGPLPETVRPNSHKELWMKYQERYQPILIGVNGTFEIDGDSLGGFLCTTAGTITVTKVNELSGANVTIINAHPVSAGIYYPLPFFLGSNGGTFTAAGGASGTLGV